MRRVTELYIRADWGLVRFLYLPALVVAIGATKLLWPLVLLSLRVAPCGICVLLNRWFHHLEEWIRVKPLMKLCDDGLLHEDGGAQFLYPWSAVTGVVLFRKNYTPFWKTDGATSPSPPYWLEIAVRADGRQDVSGDSYIDSTSYSANSRTPEVPESGGQISIRVWPRQVRGGLFSLMRFARELQRHLKYRADGGEIVRLLPREHGPKARLNGAR